MVLLKWIVTGSGAALFLPLIFWALLQANSCARQLHGFCFPGFSLRTQVPPIKHPLALGEAASRSWVPQENGAKKKEKNSCLTYMLSGIALGVVARQ